MIDYDEYISSSRGRLAKVANEAGVRLGVAGNALLYIIVVNGQVVGTWRRTLRRDAVVIETNLYTRLTAAESMAVADAARAYAGFLQRALMMA